MKLILLALGFLAALSAPASAQQSKAALTTEINTNFPDNTSGAITPAILRTTITDIVNSYVDYSGSSSFACTGSKWVSSASSLSAFTCTQPAFTDISGTLSLSQGGTNANLTASVGGVVYSTSSGLAILAGTAVASQCLLSGNLAPPTWGACSGGGGSGTVGSGTTGQLSYYPSNGTAVQGLSTANISSSPTIIGNWVFSPTSGTALAVNPATNSTAKGFNVTQNGHGTLGSFQLNSINVNSDDIAAGPTVANAALLVGHDYGGTNMTGARQTLAVQSVLTAASNATNPVKEYVSGSFLFQAQAADGGTGSGVNSKGAGFGLNSLSRFLSGATFWSEATSAEFNVDVESGASADYVNIVSLIGFATHATQGLTYDTMLALSNQTGSAKFRNGILIGPMNSQHPIDTTNGTIMATVGSSSVKSFIDFSSYTCSGGNAWSSTGYVAGCSGNLSLTPTRTITSATGATLDNFLLNSGTTTISGNTGSPITALSLARILGSTITGASSVTVTDANALVVSAPSCTASVTCTNSSSIYAVGDIKQTTGRILVGTYTGSFVPAVAQIYVTSGNGLTFAAPLSGGTNDIGMFAANGAELFTNPTGTSDVRFNAGNGHFRTGPTAPAPSACGGGSPTVVGSDTAGTITMGTTSTGCTVTFAVAFTGTPLCSLSWQSNLASMIYTVSNSAITITQTSTSSNKIDYRCFAQNGG